ncbi:hypothetical protein D3C75_1310020 [compost metagenome]
MSTAAYPNGSVIQRMIPRNGAFASGGGDDWNIEGFGELDQLFMGSCTVHAFAGND